MKNVFSFHEMKKQGEKIAMLTAYDVYGGRLAHQAGVDIILVGDSLGMVVLGYEDTLAVTMEDMISHTAAVRRGAPEAFIAVDMPYMSYHTTVETACRNAGDLVIKGRADAVKLEGGSERRIEVIRAIIDCEIPVVAHLGLTPQSLHRMGGYRVQGTDEAASNVILDQAVAVQEAGAFMLVLEGIPEALGRTISKTLEIPCIGIGAGRFTDGQVLVYQDMLGMSGNEFKFLKVYGKIGDYIAGAIETYINEVKTGTFPQKKHVYHAIKEQ